MKRHITTRVVRHAAAVIIAASTIGGAVTLAAATSASAAPVAIHATGNTSSGPAGSCNGNNGGPWGC